jgi:hypothetical protein
MRTTIVLAALGIGAAVIGTSIVTSGGRSVQQLSNERRSDGVRAGRPQQTARASPHLRAPPRLMAVALIALTSTAASRIATLATNPHGGYRIATLARVNGPSGYARLHTPQARAARAGK